MTPIHRGHATKLGLRKPPYGAYRRRWAMGVSMEEIEDAMRDNPNLKALRDWAKVDWPDDVVTWTEVLNTTPHRP